MAFSPQAQSCSHDMQAIRRALITICAVSTTALALVWVIVSVARKPSVNQSSFAALITKTPLSGLLIANLSLVTAGTLATLIVMRSRQKADLNTPSPSGWLVAFSILPLSLMALVAAQKSSGRVTDLAPFSHTALSLASALTFVLAFIFLLLERSLATGRHSGILEAGGLAALLRAVIVSLALSGFLAGCGASDISLLTWPWLIPICLTLAAACETIIRVIVRLFSPPATVATTSACIGNILFDSPLALHPARVAMVMKTSFGIDFEQSWALSFVWRAMLPVTGAMILLAWTFSGVVKIDQNQRGIYERFGIPQAVLGPGLHIVLPRPFGYVRLTEFGTIRSTVITDHADAAKAAADVSGAEGEAPESANRLWEDSPEDASYLVARSADGRAGFEMLTVNLRILYRVRLSDQGAMDALYNVSSPDELLRSLARSDLVMFFASETLEGVMATRRDKVAEIISADLQASLDQRHSGIEVVAVLIDSIQPPAAAARSWRAVQAAEVRVQMSVAEERTRAAGTAALARRDAYTLQSSAQAQAETIRKAARADATRMTGDDRAWHESGQAFLLEYYLAALKTALNGAAITVVDSRIPRSVLDLRDMPFSLLPPADSAASK
ncbi:SPFH domain-containing protein [Acetobacter fallax]|uniref:Band 7 domain-containing protein n=1 Tax=Acetobacter fallax TaxID=1737473 RepID=A0ABX0K8T8_9PROT|nr:hypothetical protein [Acetobacter fallax]